MRKVSILLISRDRLLCDLIKRTLESTACDVCVADGNPGAEPAIPVQVDLVVLDSVVLDSDFIGDLRLLDQICSMSPFPEIIVLVSSDDAREEMRLKGFGTVNKRAGVTGLVEAIRSSLGIEIPVSTPGIEIPGSHEKGCILAVDDEEAIRDMVSEFLKSRGYRVTTAQDGKSALNALERDPAIRVVLLDVLMPKMGGVETLKRIMKRRRHPAVIMMTAVADQEIARHAVKLGAFDYILKPPDLNALESVISASISLFDPRTRSIWKRLFDGRIN